MKNLPSTSFGKEVEQPVLHITEKNDRQVTDETNQLKEDAEQALQIIEEIITESAEKQAELNTPVMEEIDNFETINNEDLINLFPEETDSWLIIDNVGKNNNFDLYQQHCSPTLCNLLDYILDDRIL